MYSEWLLQSCYLKMSLFSDIHCSASLAAATELKGKEKKKEGLEIWHQDDAGGLVAPRPAPVFI